MKLSLKHSRIFCCTILSSLAGWPLAGCSAEEASYSNWIPRLTVPHAWTLETIVIDGDLRDRAWEQGTMTYGFVDETGDKAPSEATRVRIIHDYHALYIAFTVEEGDMQALSAAASDKEGMTGDAVGLSLSYKANGSIHQLNLWVDHDNNLILPSGGADIWDGHGTIETAVRKRPGSWDVEIAIPWKRAGTSSPSYADIWQANFFRNNTSNGKGSSEKSNWLPAGQMGELRFGRDCLVYLYSKRPFYSPDEVMVFNYSDRLRRFSATYLNESGEEIQGMTVHLGPGHRRQHYKMEGLKHGTYTVVVRDRDAQPGEDDVIMVVPRPQFGR